MHKLITEVTVCQNGILDPEILVVKLVDEGAGEYFQIHDGQGGMISINPEEVQPMIEAMNMMYTIKTD